MNRTPKSRAKRSTRARRTRKCGLHQTGRLSQDVTGEVLIAAMQASPHREIEIEPKRARMQVRDLTL